MIKVLNQYFPRRWAVLLVGESLLILLAMASVAWLQAGGWPITPPPLSLICKAILIALVCQVCLHYSDLYEPNTRPAGGMVLTRLLQALGIASLVLALIYWLLPQLRLSTGMVGYSVIALVALLLCWRRAVDALLSWSQRVYPSGERLLLVGAGPSALELARELSARPQLGLRVIGALRQGGPDAAEGNGLPTLGTIQELAAVMRQWRPQRIVMTREAHGAGFPMASLRTAADAGIHVENAATLLERLRGQVVLHDEEMPTWLLRAMAAPARPLARIATILSRALAVLALLLVSPLLIIVALAVRLDSPGPIIFRQQRIGRGGARFTLFKFRSMKQSADADGIARPAQLHDPRITRVGRWLRRCRLDELPQLANIVRGDLGWIGPRPFVPEQEREMEAAIPFYRYRWSVTPGVTGWAQLHQGYCATVADNAEKLAYDLFYIKNRSVWMDLFILFQTTKIVFLGRGAR